jgi:1,2-diacylglycerol 3-alpha-glucosyltransferase
MKIAIFTDTFIPQTNGVVTVVKTHAKELTKRGHEVLIFTAQPKKEQKKKVLEELAGQKIKVYFIPAFELPTYKDMRVATPTWIQSFWRMKKFGPDIIHSHTNFGVGWEAVNCAKILGVPLVGHHHTFWTDYLHHIKLDKEFMRKLTHHYTSSYYNRCDLIISPSKSLRDELLESNIKKPVKVLPNSINLEKFKINATKEDLKKKMGLKDKKVIVYFGRVSKEKSIDILLDAFQLILKKIDDTRLLIVGDGPTLNDLKKQARKLKIDSNIIFTGILKDKKLFETVATGDIFASASTSENQPMTFLEAMALGLPMVCADAKGAPELCHDGKNGLLFKPDDRRDMADCLIKILGDPKMIEKMGKESKKIANGYSNERIIEELINSYKKLIKKKSAKKTKSLS